VVTRWIVVVLVGVALLFVIAREPRGTGEPSSRADRAAVAASERGAAHAAARPPELAAVDEATGAPIGDAAAASLERLEGLVVDADDRPVAGARVSVGGRHVMTEGDGSFAFDGLTRGEYTVIAERGGWYAEEQEVRLGEDTEPVTLQLALGATLVVRILDEAGAPIAGANIHVSGRDYKTGADGVARARGVDLEGEMVAISAPGHAGTRERVDTGDDPAATIERTFVLPGGAAISGVVVDEKGARVADAYVELESSVSGRTESAWTDEQGAWKVADLGRATYVMKASSPASISAGDQVVAHDGARARDGIVLRVGPGAEIEGDVVDASGAPVADARISGGSVSATTDEAGHFVARGLVADTYTLSVASPTHGAVDQVVMLAKGQKARVRFVVVPSNIAGFVVDARGQPVEDATIAARSESPAGFGFARSDERGRFDTGGLPPGRYQVTVSRGGSRVDSKAIEIATGTRDARLVVLDAARVTGRVLLDGKPVSYFGYALTEDADNVYSRPTTVRDEAGRFVEKDAEPGTYALVIVGPAFARTAIANVRVVPGQTTDLGDIAVTRGQVLRGRVVDGSGAGVAGATVALSRDAYGNAPLARLMSGARSATTDARGAFEIPGLVPGDGETTLEATHPVRGISAVTIVPPGGSAVLVLAPTGALEGQVQPPSRELYRAVARRIDQPGRYTAEIDRSGAFRFAQLPPGEYELDVVGELVAGQPHATIAPGATARVMIVLAPE